MGTIEEALREKVFPTLFGGEEIDAEFRKIIGHSVKHVSLSIEDPRLLEEGAYNISKAASGDMVDSLLGDTALNYVINRACVRGVSAGAKK